MRFDVRRTILRSASCTLLASLQLGLPGLLLALECVSREPLRIGRVVRGRVRDPSGSPVPGTTIYLRPLQPGAETRSTVTDSSGSFEFDKLPPGDYELTGSLLSFTPASVTVRLHRFSRNRALIVRLDVLCSDVCVARDQRAASARDGCAP